MDVSIPTVESVLQFATRWPALVAIIVGGLAAWFVTIVVERYFMPTAHDPDTLRHQKGATFILNWLLGGAFSSALWHAFVAGVPVRVTTVVSFVVGAVTAFAYPILAKLATNRWPAIGSAWQARE